MGCVCSIFRCGVSFVAGLPYCSLLGFFATFVGGVVALASKGSIAHTFKVLHLSQAAFVLDYVWLLFVLTIGVNGIAAFQAITTSGKPRELLYSHSEHWCCCCLQYLLGIGMQLAIFVALIGTFVANLLCGYAVLFGLVMIIPVRITCDMGMEPLESVLQVVGLLSGFIGESFDASTFSNTVLGDVKIICSEGSLTDGIGHLCAGAIMCLLAQVWMLVLSYGNIIKVGYTMDKRDPMSLAD
mmetsp:Transcript_18792/g.59091  ORF Transcript_18792/g.59091 Transcript_18792/m.59091 type:complete len:241 (-) Transcript_18792:128-850(-)